MAEQTDAKAPEMAIKLRGSKLVIDLDPWNLETIKNLS